MGEARPILFNADMVQALLSGRKTQTRRIVKPQPIERLGLVYFKTYENFGFNKEGLKAIGCFELGCPFGKVGDLLWVRETLECANGEAIGYPADGMWLPNDPWIWKRRTLPSIHMPKWASRLTLEITDIKVERLFDITDKDCIAEGCEGCESLYYSPHDEFFELWKSINGQASLDSNPWVWAISFKVHNKNVDELLKEKI